MVMHTRFCRNQHQILVRRLFHIQQTGSVEEYVKKFVELLDQISVYEASPDPIHYMTIFLDGLKPTGISWDPNGLNILWERH